MLASSRPAFAAVYLAAMRIGAIPVPVEFGEKFLGRYGSIHCLLINRQARLKPRAQFAIARASWPRVGIDSAAR